MPKQRKRAIKGDGTVYQRKDGRWVGSFQHGHKRKYVYAATQREAREKLRTLQRDAEQGTLVEPSKLKTGEFLEYWLRVHGASIRQTTVQSYASYIHMHIIPALGHITLQKLSPDHIQAFYASLVNAELEASTIRSIHTIFKAALADAVEWEKIKRNPCEKVRTPRVAKREMEVLNQEQIQVLLSAVQGHPLECLVTLALATGMRKGELLALHWNDIDLERKVVHVRHTLTYVAKRGHKESEPKTQASRRSIVLADVAVQMLKRHRMQQRIQSIQVRDKWTERGLVFCGRHGNYCWTGQVHKQFKHLLLEAELPIIRFHDLRHSAATALLVMKVPPKVVQEILGHSSIAITMDIYSHVLPHIQQEAMANMNTFLKGNTTAQSAI